MSGGLSEGLIFYRVCFAVNGYLAMRPELKSRACVCGCVCVQ